MAVQQVKPGEFLVPELGRVIRITDVRQDDFYDTVALGTAQLTAGQQLKPFDSVSSKGRQFCNLTTARRIPGRNRFNLLRTGYMIRHAAGAALALAADMIRLYEAGSLKFSINTRLLTEGPLVKYQSGYGLSGTSTEADVSLITLGPASHVAAPKYLAAQPINDEDDLDCEINYQSIVAWDSASALPTPTARTFHSIFLHGIIEKPITT